jgi:glyoxylase-like metal-dependent hydrolase (beta-lactamase superfamily II)
LVAALKAISWEGVSLKLKYLLHTHAHLDHIGATRHVKEAFSESQIALHRADEPLYGGLQLQGTYFGLVYDEPLPIDQFLEEQQVLEVGDLRVSILHTPGHSPGSICMQLHASRSDAPILLTGDTLFREEIGRTDLWGGDEPLMLENIHQKILTLPQETRICPGHGPDTSVGWERSFNPYLHADARRLS